jgi:hypothetical protein
MKAHVLIIVRPGCIHAVIDNLRNVYEVTEANMTFSPYDVASVIETGIVNNIGWMLAQKIQPIPGVLETLTCLIVDN